ncbi:MAG: murein hydrolase activator EnvC family protein [Betaproteobacteria bacterium]|nr:peptidoglycan DD-metalloendopeptidase family protein [Rhodocyclaceae bacterium]MCA3135915.1 peptidoglycan DD-metalloendopeptidase family protein [Rhodocyclaceae bacterium]MCA3140802.1 peptidoglycan DD-metalloendopeptidase family protein [Rhodocyclaceae bacterium]MCA3146021.1 peptidoglycan DD-metalloendopeptidase family protein [Rhodocyclaceae bacterium]MCE2899001.1 peptidoglycan DD-metalloendopeptidase family protein [Betaproteobacteria bacterium]
MRGRIEALREELRSSEDSRAEAARRLRDSELATRAANSRLRGLAAQRKHVQGALEALSLEGEAARARLARNRDALAHLLRHRYIYGNTEPLRLVLSGRDPDAVGRDLRYLGYVSRARGALMADLRANLQELNRIADQTRTRGEELAAIEAGQAEQRKTLEAEQAARREILAAASATVVRQRREIADLRRDEERLSKLVLKLAKAAAPPARTRPAPPARVDERNPSNPMPASSGGGLRVLKGRMRLPVDGELAARFGSPREGSGISSMGVFIRARTGQEVRSVAPGRVVFADWLRGFGNLLIVDHGEGYLSLYGNNEALLHRAGTEVRIGEPLATVGASGSAERSGLYFEVRFRGKPFDPLPWMQPD